MPLVLLLLALLLALPGSGFVPAERGEVVSVDRERSPLACGPDRPNLHVCRYVHDGLGRMIKQVCDLRVGGTGAGAIDTSNPRNPDGQINLSYVFDGDSRLTGIVDDNGNRTTFEYDALSRRKRQILADGSATSFTFDKDDNVRTVTDSNGSVFTKQYDALNRLTQMDVVRGLGVGGTKQQTFSYDGVSRLVRATDDNGSAIATQVCEWAFDSLGRMVEERQNGQAVSSRYSGDGKRTQVTYPSGRTITRGFDAIDRITSLADGAGVIAQSEFVGPGLRELRRTNRNGTALSFLNDAGNADIGFDAVQRLVRLRVLGTGGSAIVDREYAYNRASQRTSEKRNDDFGLTDTYTYDSAYRIVTSSFDQFGLSGATPRDTTNVSYVLDGVGNRRNVAKQSTSLGVVAESFVVNAVNEYASIQTGAAPAVTRGHDQNGNVIDDGTKLLTWDALNRLVGVLRKSDLRPIAMYRYLPDGRRSRKQVWNPDTNTLVKDVVSVWDGAQEVEEQVAGVAVATYVWSPVYVDELVSFTNASGTYFAHQDARCDVVAITNASGSVVERRRYDDYGREERLSGAGASGCEYGFQGRKLDAETGLWFFRARYYDPALGRFMSRDPIWDAGNVGGQYSFCGNGPASGRDPGGMQQYRAPGIGGISDPDPRAEPTGQPISSTLRDRLMSDYEPKQFTKQDAREGASMGVGLIPGVGDVKDLQEVITGRDLIAGTKLTTGERVVTGLALIVGSGAIFRKIWREFRTVEHLGSDLRRLAGSAGKRVAGVAADLEALAARLCGKNVEIVTGEEAIKELDRLGFAAAFEAGKDGAPSKLWLRPDASVYEVEHELLHLKHYKANPEDYLNYETRRSKEQFVYDALMQMHRDGKITLSAEELKHAADYLGTIRGTDPSRWSQLPTNLYE